MNALKEPEIAMLWKTLFAEIQRREHGPAPLTPNEWKRMQWASSYPFKDRRAVFDSLVRRGFVVLNNGSRLTEEGRRALDDDRAALR